MNCAVIIILSFSFLLKAVANQQRSLLLYFFVVLPQSHEKGNSSQNKISLICEIRDLVLNFEALRIEIYLVLTALFFAFPSRRRPRRSLDFLPRIWSASSKVRGGHWPSACNFFSRSNSLMLMMVLHLGNLPQPRKGPFLPCLITSSPSLHL